VTLASAAPSDELEELPPGWELAPLGDVCALNPRRAIPASLPDDAPVTFVPMPAVNAELGAITAPVTRSLAAVRKGFTAFHDGDVIMAKITPCMENGKAAVASNLENGLGFGSTEFHVLRPGSGILAGYVFHFIRRESFRKEAEERMTGSVGQKRVPAEFVGSHLIPVPPLDAQRRIVAALDATLGRLDAARARLQRVPEILKRYRASLLKAACEGRLVPTEAELARAEERDYEPADVLLARILEERRAKWKEAELAKYAKAGKQPPTSWRAQYKEPAAPDADNLPELPEGWCWTTLPALGELNRGKSRHRPRNDPGLLGGPYPFIQTGDVTRSGGSITSHAQTYSDAGLDQSRLWPAGTVCITIAANIAETGVLTYPACFPDSVVGFLPCEGFDAIAPFVERFLRTARSEIDRYAPGTAQKNINLEILGEVAVPLPPYAEQRRIVADVARQLAAVERIEAAAAANLKRCEQMREAVLAKAFRGELA